MRQRDLAAATDRPSCGRIEAKIAMHELATGRSRAPEQRAHPHEQLLDRERLHEIVVAAGVEARDPIGDRIAGGQKQDRQCQPFARAPFRDCSPSMPGHRNVQHQQIGKRALELGERAPSVRRLLARRSPPPTSVRSSIRRIAGSSSTIMISVIDLRVDLASSRGRPALGAWPPPLPLVLGAGCISSVAAAARLAPHAAARSAVR